MEYNDHLKYITV